MLPDSPWLVEYDPCWPRIFESAAERIRDVLSARALEHDAHDDTQHVRDRHVVSRC
jgi:hypothetical protein